MAPAMLILGIGVVRGLKGLRKNPVRRLVLACCLFKGAGRCFAHTAMQSLNLQWQIGFQEILGQQVDADEMDEKKRPKPLF